MKNITIYALMAVILTIFLVGNQFESVDHQFESFKLEFQKKYLSESDEQYRKLIFLKNKARIELHNSDPEQTYKKGINQFADMTLSQLQQMYSDLVVPSSLISAQTLEDKSPRVGVSIDWDESGKVSPVIDQGQCGASWAFSAAGAFESAHMIKGNNISASAQELLDCTSQYGNYGCSGGYMSASFKYIKQHNIHETKDYPYTGNNDKCKHPAGKTWTLSSYTDFTGCDGLYNSIFFGPVSVAVDLSTMYDYHSGIVTKCGNTPTSGSLLIGVTDTYWRLKQSFGTRWGQGGYFKLARGNTCAVCTIASFPTI